MICVRGLRKRYPRGGTAALEDVSFELPRGTLAAVLGPSGAGKSTLLRCIVGLERPDAGEVTTGGQVGLVFQSLELFPHLSALQNCALAPRRVKGLGRHEAEARARALLERLGLGDRVDAYPDHLSGGQRQRVAIARALAMDPAVLLYDEPTSALDPSLRREVAATLRQVAETGVTQVVVTHDVGLARTTDSVLILEAGRVVEQGQPARVLEAPAHEATRRLLVEAGAAPR